MINPCIKMKYKEVLASNAVLVIFYSGLKLIDKPIAEARNIAAYFGPDVEVVKVEKLDNQHLCDALRLTEDLTYIIYSHGELIERMDGYTEESVLKEKMLNLLNSLKTT